MQKGYHSRAPTTAQLVTKSIAVTKKQRKQKKKTVLPTIGEVLQMAQSISKTLGVRTLPVKYMRKRICKRIPIPQIYDSEDYRLWIDRHYIAIQSLDGIQPVCYLYVSLLHISEERVADYKAALRKRTPALDAPTLAQFAAALRAMKQSGKGVRFAPTVANVAPDRGI